MTFKATKANAGWPSGTEALLYLPNIGVSPTPRHGSVGLPVCWQPPTPFRSPISGGWLQRTRQCFRCGRGFAPKVVGRGENHFLVARYEPQGDSAATSGSGARIETQFCVLGLPRPKQDCDLSFFRDVLPAFEALAKTWSQRARPICRC